MLIIDVVLSSGGLVRLRAWSICVFDIQGGLWASDPPLILSGEYFTHHHNVVRLRSSVFTYFESKIEDERIHIRNEVILPAIPRCLKLTGHL